jgi:hypothetical protein
MGTLADHCIPDKVVGQISVQMLPTCVNALFSSLYLSFPSLISSFITVLHTFGVIFKIPNANVLYSTWNIISKIIYSAFYLNAYYFLGKGWIKQMLFSTALFPSMVCGTAFLINFVAIYYRASRAIPFTSMVS